MEPHPVPSLARTHVQEETDCIQCFNRTAKSQGIVQKKRGITCATFRSKAMVGWLLEGS